MKRVFIALILIFFGAGTFAYPLNISGPEISSALNYLKSQQDADGCIGGFATSAWVINSISAAGEDPTSEDWSSNGNSLVDCIKADASWFNDGSRNATDFERQIIAIVAAGEDPSNFNGLDYVSKLKSMYDGTQMGNAGLLNDDQWGIIALIAAGEQASSTEIQGMVAFLEANQGADNGWSWGAGQASDADSTATAIMALIAAGRDKTGTHIQNALAYLQTQQDAANAGFMSYGTTNPDTSAYSVDAIVAAGQQPTSGNWQKNGTNPIEYILTWQQADGGFSNPYASPQLASSTWTTANALNALLGKPYPVKVLQTLEMAIRIEAPSQTIFDGEIELPHSISFNASNSESSYTITAPSLLIGLLAAGTEQGFSVSASDEWYHSFGSFYVHNVAGHEAAGLDGWNFRVDNKTTGFHSANSFIWQKSNPPNPPHNEVVWFYGNWDANALRITTESTTIETGTDIIVRVENYHESEGAWYPVSGAIVKGADTEQATNEQGTATIRFSSGGTKHVYAEKPSGNYFRSAKLELNAEDQPQAPPDDSSSVQLNGKIVPAISFSVNPSSIDFGKFGPGYHVQGPNLFLENTGSWNIDVRAEVTANAGTLYARNLLLNGDPWKNFFAQITADVSDYLSNVSVSTLLNVPSDYSGTGTETGTLTFWATATGPPR